MRFMQKLSMTWLGHGTFIFTTPGGKRVLVDPWLQGNPSCPAACHKPEQIDLILVTHGHSDHIDDLLMGCGQPAGESGHSGRGAAV